ncbi:MAG: DUF2778 domain-containing protein [Rhizobiaceae bacterium]|nr:DUF2778 domain-containing protein [Rhizobiaceae bacterium]
MIVGSSIASGSSQPLAMANLYTMGSALMTPEPAEAATGPRLALATFDDVAEPVAPRAAAAAPKAAAAVPAPLPSAPKSRRLAAADPAPKKTDSDARFAAVVKRAEITPAKLAGLFAKPAAATQKAEAVVKIDTPAPARFAAVQPALPGQPALLAFADPAPAGSAEAALATLLSDSDEGNLARLQDSDLGLEDDSVAIVPDYEDTPSDAPLPDLRPQAQEPRKPAVEEDAASPQIEKPAPVAQKPDAPRIEAPRQVERQEKPRTSLFAFAKPDAPVEKPSGGDAGQALRGLFGGSRAGKGVAVYDISAAKVYMPDGSVLEAHSGIGKMADDPRYVSVKMNGPTPPHTYNLKMRETRFHGVEAIRMLPIDGKNKHGRDGFLTHSYLLRGGRAESHGCVAFKDYEKFLRAFKQGKVKQIVVVPSGGRAVRLASNGKAI